MKKIVIVLLVFIACVCDAAASGRAGVARRPIRPRHFGEIKNAILHDNINLIQQILNQYPDAINEQDPCDRPLLHYAVTRNNPEMAELLIMRGVDINARDNSGDTALMDAVMVARPALVRLLLTQRADTTLKNKSGDTVFTITPGINAGGKDIDARVAEVKKLLEPYKQQEKKAGASSE